MTTVNRHETDVVVVGGGGAALRAALEALRAGARVRLITKDDWGPRGPRRSRWPRWRALPFPMEREIPRTPPTCISKTSQEGTLPLMSPCCS